MNDKLEEARGRLQAALQDMSDFLAPRSCPHGDYAACEECDWDDTASMSGSGAMLSEFVLVMSWTRMDDGENYVGMQTAPKQLITHTNGLLYTALHI
jgi:hypothetical protein